MFIAAVVLGVVVAILFLICELIIHSLSLCSKAQKTLFAIWSSYKALSRDIIPRVLPLISDKQAPDGAATGAVYIATELVVLRTIVGSWRWLRLLLQHLIGGVVHDKPTLQARLYQLYMSATKAVYPIALVAPKPSGTPAPDYARTWLSTHSPSPTKKILSSFVLRS